MSSDPKSPVVIAAGGFGLIVSDGKVVTKLHHTAKSCKDGQAEFYKARRVYESFKGVRCVTTPQPIGFSMTEKAYNGKKFMCSFTMEAVRGVKINGREMLVHAVLSQPQFDKEIGQNQNKEVGPDNPTRGWHAGEKNLLARAGVEPAKVAQRIGSAIVHMVMDAQIYPFDVEYLVGNKQSLVVLDFGMAEIIPLKDYADMDSLVQKLFEVGGGDAVGIADDIYYPSLESEYKLDFYQGMKNAAAKCKMPEKAQYLLKYVAEDLGIDIQSMKRRKL